MEDIATVTLEQQLVARAKPVNAFQTKSLKQFENIGLPEKKSEAYKFTPIKSILTENFTWDQHNNFSIDPVVNKHLYPIENANHLVFLNGEYSAEQSIIKSSSENLIIEAIDSSSERVSKLGSVADQENDSFAAWNGSMATVGLYIEVKKNTKNIPTFIYHICDSATSESYSFPRIFIVSNSGSELSLYEKLVVEGENKVFLNSVIETDVHENASLKYTKNQNYSTQVFSVEGIFSKQASNSRFYTNTYSFSGALIRNNINIAIEGENCEGHMNGIYLLNGKTHVDNNTAVDHKAPNSYSNELYKGILNDSSKGVFNGKIYVRPIAQKTNAFQSNNNVILSENATVHTKPQLEIWADDVKCSHGCTVGQLDEEAIFYLQSRGISKDSAITLMLNAFTQDTLHEVDEELVKNEIIELIEKGLNHG